MFKYVRRLVIFEYLKTGTKFFFGRINTNHFLGSFQNCIRNRVFLSKDYTKINQRLILRNLRLAYKKSSYYKNLLTSSNIDLSNFDYTRDWERIPFLTKDLIRENFKGMLTMKVRDYVGFITTGGSTGTPLGFYRYGGYDPEHQFFLFKLIGFDRRNDRILWMGGTELSKTEVEKNIFWKEHNVKYYKYYSLSSQYLTKENWRYYIEFFLQYKPTIIRGYPSFVFLFCEYLKDNNIKITHEIKGVELTSEVAYDYQKTLIKKVLGADIFLQYGHAEGSVFGFSLANDDEIYCSPFYGLTEVIDDQGKHVNEGEIGEIVVTGVDNYAMQFIRYRTGDLAKFKGNKNGITILSKVFGRTQDIIYDIEMNKILVTAIIYGMHYKAFNNIKQFQMVQKKPGEIIFNIVKGEGYTQDNEEELRSKFKDIASFRTTFNYLEAIPLTKRGKQIFLIQEVKDEVTDLV